MEELEEDELEVVLIVDDTGVLDEDELEVVLIVDDTGVDDELELVVQYSQALLELEDEDVVTTDEGAELVVEFSQSFHLYSEDDEEVVVITEIGVDDDFVEDIVVILADHPCHSVEAGVVDELLVVVVILGT